MKIASKYATALVAFVLAGYLVFAILDENGGDENSQLRWQMASENTVSIGYPKGSQTEYAINERLGIDRTITGSIRNIAEEKKVVAVPVFAERKSQDLTVLELIRNNSDISPGVSAGTDRVSVVVKKGDTLFGISNRHGIGVNTLARLNGLEEPYTIKVGQTLYLAR